jgi:enoyl-CoA hydratase
MPELVSVGRQGDVAVVTIDHPPVNALNEAVVDGLDATFADLGADESVRVALVCGAGDRAFVAGADISEFPRLRAAGDGYRPRLPEVLNAIEAFPKPVVAAIHGFCLGGGLELAMACDVRVCAEDARLGQPEIQLGLIPGAGGTQRLPRLVGEKRALYLNLSGEFLSGTQAYEWGLVERVVPASDLRQEAFAVAARLAERSPHALRVMKELALASRDSPLDRGLELERAAFARCFASEDGGEGVAAFLEKRPPRWTGR